MSATLADLAHEKYVNLTTFRKDGTPVSTPVWLAVDAGDIVVTTSPDTGKVKRVRHTARVTLTPSDMRGRVQEGAPTVEAVAQVDEDPAEAERVTRLITRRYGLLGRLIPFVERVRAGKAAANPVIIRIGEVTDSRP